MPAWPLPEAVVAWCRQWLGAPPERLLFQVRHISTVSGLQMADGRLVVLKVRPPAARLHACFLVQQSLWQAGFPCPEPLVGPEPLEECVATAERFVPGGAQLRRGADGPQRFARALARLVALAPPVSTLPSLEPPPYWLCWEHDQPGTWPLDPDVALNERPGPAWLEKAVARARHRLLQVGELPAMVGHGDWESQNLRWVERRLHVAHDWDSVVALPEAAIAGAASIVFPTSGGLHEQASMAGTARFLEAYEEERGRPWSREEREICWAAGLWVQGYKAKKAAVGGGGQRLLAALAGESEQRLRRASA